MKADFSTLLTSLRLDRRNAGTRVSSYRVALVALVTTLLGVVGLVCASLLERAWYQALLDSISSAVVSIGAVGLIYELLIRSAVQRELLQLVGISNEVARSNLRGVAEGVDFPWIDHLAHASDLSVVHSCPDQWIAQWFDKTLQGARARPLRLRLLVPNFRSPNPAMAAMHAATTQSYAASIENAIEDAERLWKQRKSSLPAGSSFLIALAAKDFYGALAVSDGLVIQVCYAQDGKLRTEAGMIFVYSRAESRFPSSWLLERMEDQFSNAVTTYANEV